jgi:dihydroorotase/N-acyl-D-amino-acid deacylase
LLNVDKPELAAGNLLIEEGKIASTKLTDPPADCDVINCERFVVSPGFIDAHSHSDLQVLEQRPEKVLQGVTAEVVGNCGFSAFPMSGNGAELRDFGNGILHGDQAWGWRSAAEYLQAAHERAGLASVFALVGHGALRIAFAGLKQGPLERSVVERMCGALDEALAQGAIGFSTGLMYAPGSSAPREELEELCRVIARRGKIYCTHMRNYGTNLLAAIDEQLEIAQAAGCKLHISHLQTVGRANWHLNERALAKISKARDAAIDVTFDCYPYVAGSTVLTQLLPQWALDGGFAALARRLDDSATRAEIAREMEGNRVHEWSDIFISGVATERNADAVGRSLVELSELRSQEPLECVFSLLLEEAGRVNMLQFNQSEANLKENLTHPLSMVISDGFYVSGWPHPRLHGTFPEFLGNVCRDKRWIGLPEALHKVTSAPAERFGLTGRGRLTEGAFADICVFDPQKIVSHATYQEPTRSPEGIMRVFRAGRQIGPVPANAEGR